jgi:hypothetical protein
MSLVIDPQISIPSNGCRTASKLLQALNSSNAPGGHTTCFGSAADVNEERFEGLRASRKFEAKRVSQTGTEE